MEDRKTLIIFDFDYTMIDVDSLYEQSRLSLTPEETEQIIKYDHDITKGFEWTIEYFYQKLKSKNKTLSDVNSYIDTIKLGKGFPELLNFLHEHNKKFDLIVVSGDIDYPIKRVLKNHSFLEYFNNIIAVQSEPDEEKIINFKPLEKSGCPLCEPNGCKTFCVKKYFEKNGILWENRDKYERFIFICDGSNDLCLAKNLDKNDILFPRKDFNLYKKLYEKGQIDNIKCNVQPWNNAFDILDSIQSL